jgi:hypothetical protein
MVQLALYPVRVTCPSCGRSGEMDARQMADESGRPISFQLIGEVFSVVTLNPVSGEEVIVECACGERFAAVDTP